MILFGWDTFIHSWLGTGHTVSRNMGFLDQKFVVMALMKLLHVSSFSNSIKKKNRQRHFEWVSTPIGLYFKILKEKKY